MALGWTRRHTQSNFDLELAVGPGHRLRCGWASHSGLPVLGFGRRPNWTSRDGHLIPLVTAILSLVLLSEAPHWYHALGFVLIAGGLWLTAKAQRSV